MKTRLAEGWETFLGAVDLKDAPEIQRKEMRRAFYAGAATLYNIVMRGMSPGSEILPGDLNLLADLQAEMKAFSEDVKAGRA